MLTRSMAGGIAASLGLLPRGVRSLGARRGLADDRAAILHDRIAGSAGGFGLTAHEDIALATVVLVIAAWAIGLIAAGVIRVTARDVH